MSIETTQEKPAYHVQADGDLVLNKAGMEVGARYREARAEQARLDNCWAGAVLAGLFLKHLWLDAVRLSFEVRSEYDDSGGFYRCVSCRVSVPRAVPGHPLPEEASAQGEFDPDAAVSFLEDEVEDNDWDLYAGLAEHPEGYDDLTVTLERSAIAELLLQVPFDGSLACTAWGLTRPTRT